MKYLTLFIDVVKDIATVTVFFGMYVIVIMLFIPVFIVWSIATVSVLGIVWLVCK